MTFETFLFLLLITSVLTGLFTEGIKKVLAELNRSYKANILAGVVAAAVSAVTGVGYIILTSATINNKLIFILVALVLMSWLCAMVGYDKVVQAIAQLKIPKEEV